MTFRGGIWLAGVMALGCGAIVGANGAQACGHGCNVADSQHTKAARTTAGATTTAKAPPSRSTDHHKPPLQQIAKPMCRVLSLT
jgi:hypothetical protein